MDRFDKNKRSEIMASVRSENTAPELAVQSILTEHGIPFETHVTDIPGKPDLFVPSRDTAIFVHGCFWHYHPGCPKAEIPKTNSKFWKEKIFANVDRDQHNLDRIREMGYDTLVIWECEVDNESTLKRIIDHFDLSRD